MSKPSKLHGRLFLRLTNSETPAMVFVQSRGRTIDSGTYWRVCQEGFDVVELTPGEQDWLIDIEPLVEKHCEEIAQADYEAEVASAYAAHTDVRS